MELSWLSGYKTLNRDVPGSNMLAADVVALGKALFLIA